VSPASRGCLPRGSGLSPAGSAARPGVTVLLTGLPSAGTTTLATHAIARLTELGWPAESLDGDVVRRRFWPELGMSQADREQNLARISGLAAMLARNGVIAVVAAIAPYRAARLAMREEHRAAGLELLEVHVATPVQVCRRRDVKGLYARQARGEIHGLTGVDAVYEAPLDPQLRIDTEGQQVAESVAALVGFLLDRAPWRP
jgi:adenylylsulfate kinase